MPALYVVATPIGNLEDITLRALRTLREVSLIAAEDTRKTRRLLDAYEIRTPMTSYFEHNKLAKLDYILSRLEAGDVALVSEAGTPGISDPGYELIRAVGERGMQVVPIPGASAVISALAVSGLPTDRFTFPGFLPGKAGERKKRLAALGNDPGTLVFYEAPHRLLAALTDMLAVLGDRQIAVCRELTKLHEEVFRGTVSGALEHFDTPRGEFTLVVAGKKEEARPVISDDVTRRLEELRTAGMRAKEAVAAVSEATGVPRRDVYRVWLGLEKQK